MVTVQDIGLQLTKPVKELAEWNYPFSQTLEKYCTLFNATCNKSFGEAGLVLQNSTAVYAHRIDSLWNKTDYFRNIFSNHEHSDKELKNPHKKRDRKTDMRFQEFKMVNFAEEVDKNINIKKTAHDIIKPKNRHFTQLEKGISEHISIDIYDVNGEVISKKYDFRCNQNIGMDGILVDEFAPQDFCCDVNNSAQEESLLTSLNHELSCNALTSDSIYNDNDENANSDAESEKNSDTLQENEISDLVTSLETNEQSLFSSTNVDMDNTLIQTSTNISNDSCHDVTVTNISNENCSVTSDNRNLSIMTNIDNTISLNNNDADDKCSNNKQSIDVCSLLDTPPESVNSKGGRTSSTDDPGLLSDSNEDLTKTKIIRCINSLQNTPITNTKNRKRLPFTLKSTAKSLKRKLLKPSKKGQNITKRNVVHVLKEQNSSPRNRSSMFNKGMSTCVKYIREYNPLQYEDVTNADSDFLGFRLHVNTITDTNINDNVTTISIDDEICELHSPSPSPIGTSPPHENFCDIWFRSDSPHSLPRNVDKWHELMQPKLREAEQRSTFCIRDYGSRIEHILTTNNQQKINFDTVIREQRTCDMARYFLALLQLASDKTVGINVDKNIEQNIEIFLLKNGQCSRDDQIDSRD